MTADIEIRSSSRKDDEQRDAFVEAHPQGTFFHLAGWGRVVQRVFWRRVRGTDITIRPLPEHGHKKTRLLSLSGPSGRRALAVFLTRPQAVHQIGAS